MNKQEDNANAPQKEAKKIASDTGVAAPATETPAPAPASALDAYKAAHNGKGPPTTRGEKLFNLLDYYGIGFVANAAVSMYLSDRFKHTGWKPARNKMAEKIGEGATDIATLSTGGFLFTIPIKLMEDHKEWWVRKLDGMFGAPCSSAQKAQEIEARYEEIKQEPKQTWASEFGARILGFLMNFAVIGAFMGEKNIVNKMGIPFEGLEIESAKLTEKNLAYLHDAEARPYIAEKVAQWETHLGRTPQALAEKMAQEGRADDFPPLSGKERLENLIKLTYLEVACTASCTTMQFIWSRILAPVLGKKAPQEKEAAAVAQAPSSNSTAASNTSSDARGQRSVVFNGMAIDVPSPQVTQATTASRAQEPPAKAAKDKKERPSPEAIASHAERVSSAEPAAETARYSRLT